MVHIPLWQPLNDLLLFGVLPRHLLVIPCLLPSTSYRTSLHLSWLRSLLPLVPYKNIIWVYVEEQRVQNAALSYSLNILFIGIFVIYFVVRFWCQQKFVIMPISIVSASFAFWCQYKFEIMRISIVSASIVSKKDFQLSFTLLKDIFVINKTGLNIDIAVRFVSTCTLKSAFLFPNPFLDPNWLFYLEIL